MFRGKIPLCPRRIRAPNTTAPGQNTSVPTTAAPATNTTIPPTLGPTACSGQPNNFTFTASAATINAGQSVTLNWGAVNNASIAVLNGGAFNNQGVGAPGSISTKPNATTTYALTATCNNGGGTRTNSVTVTVNASAAPTISGCAGPGNFTFTTSAGTITAGQSVTLSWSAIPSADQVKLFSGTPNGETVNTPGSRTVSPGTTTTYELSALCTLTGVSKTAQVTVTVTGGQPACSGTPGNFSFNGSSGNVTDAQGLTITSGQSVTLKWSAITNASEVRLTGGGINEVVSVPGSRVVSPTSNTTYDLDAKCNTSGDAVHGSVSVTVTGPAPACSGTPTLSTFTASATTITAGQSVTLSWGAATNADQVILDGGAFNSQNVTAPGSASVSPNTTTTYILLAVCNATGITSVGKSITINVNP